MMGGSFGSAAMAFLLFPVLIVILAAGVVLGAGGLALFMWVFS